MKEWRPSHIAVVGPIATADIAPLLDGDVANLPVGYAGAPLLTTLIGELLRRGHRVTAVTMSGGMKLDWRQHVVARGANLEMVYVPMRRRAWRPNGLRLGRILDLYAFERLGLKRALELAMPDVVHAHWSYEFAWAALQCRIPHVITCHDAPFVVARLTRSPYRWLRAGMAWHVLRRAQRVTAVSPYMQELIQPLCKVPVEVIPNPLPDTIFSSPRQPLPGRARVAMICNGWDARKNPDAALRAFALISAQLPQAELHAYGYGFGPGQTAERWWHTQGLQGRVHFRGSLPYKSLPGELAQSDVLLHSALEESFGMVIAEAMAVGVPVIGGKSSGAVPWVVGTAGQLVDVTKPDAIADATVQLLNDARRIEDLGQLARTQAHERFNVARVVEEYENAYRMVLGCCRP